MTSQRDTEAAELLRKARTTAGLTQTQLAKRAEVAQSVISDYESSRRQPSLPTLRRLIEASGQNLTVDVDTTTRRDLAEVIDQNRAAIHRIAARHGATNLRVFGSVARGDYTAESDIDLVADLPRTISLVGLAALRRELTELLEVPVDVVPSRSLRPDVTVHVEQEAIAV